MSMQREEGQYGDACEVEFPVHAKRIEKLLREKKRIPAKSGLWKVQTRKRSFSKPVFRAVPLRRSREP
jgi:hypothetical protein